ncbi:alpha/beta fold hydrolase [Mycobacterium sp. AMU20-3851]|uniref:alpha/beta fold hydrolase n=1 Tax=Mycobacterium sp. AMU20-3851 TaxID=3122055 RepID=UPI0037541551
MLAAGIILTAGGTFLAARSRPSDEPTADVDPAGPIPQAPALPDRPLEHRCVPAHFAATAHERPGQVAIRTVNSAVTYRELLSATHACIRPRPAGSGPHVALLSAPLTPAALATVLGLFASGIAVVALDPAMPQSRAGRITTILTEHGYRLQHLQVPDELPAGPVPEPGPGLGAGTGPDDVASIQFTSGSTGTPKAVLHPHGLWLADAQLLNDRFGLGDGRKVALCMPISFAAGLNVAIAALVGGAEIIAIDPQTVSAAEALDRIVDAEAQAITCTPAFVDALHTAARGRTLPAVQRIVTTGEPAHARHVRLARELAPKAVFTNWAGSTETLAIASYDIPPTAALPHGVIPVGIPAPHKRIDIGEAGAVSITSRHLALGYLDPSASASAFTTHPDGSRTYAGGDVGRWDEQGNLVLSGRVDATVKIRGYLVEPSEIESTLLSYDDVREATVVAATVDGAATLTAYLSTDPESRTPAVAELRARLHRDLPAYMVPTHLMVLPALPRGDRGKIDRMALPPVQEPEFAPPRGAAETSVARLWSEVLRVQRVGREDGFYALGGDSLSVTQMLARVTEVHGVRLKPSDLAGAPTVAEFAVKLAGGTTVGPSTRDSTTVALRPVSADTVGAPIFCFPGAGASSLSFRPLAERLGPQTAVYALEPKGLEKRAVPDLSVRAAARRQVRNLRHVQPRGPYILVGHSLGAHIALEAARLLEDEGEAIELLVLLDPWLSPRAARHARRDLPDVQVTLQETVPTDARSWWEHQKKLPLAGLFVGGLNRRTAAVEEIGIMTGLRYVPQPWAGRALVVLSHLNKDDPRLWPRVLTGKLSVERLECTHASIIREPHVGAVRALIDDLRH